MRIFGVGVQCSPEGIKDGLAKGEGLRRSPSALQTRTALSPVVAGSAARSAFDATRIKSGARVECCGFRRAGLAGGGVFAVLLPVRLSGCLRNETDSAASMDIHHH